MKKDLRKRKKNDPPLFSSQMKLIQVFLHLFILSYSNFFIKLIVAIKFVQENVC